MIPMSQHSIARGSHECQETIFILSWERWTQQIFLRKNLFCVKMSWMNSVSKASDQHNYSECPLITNTSFTSLLSIILLSFKEWIFFSHCAVSLNVSPLKHNVVKSTSNKSEISTAISRRMHCTLWSLRGNKTRSSFRNAQWRTSSVVAQHKRRDNESTHGKISSLLLFWFTEWRSTINLNNCNIILFFFFVIISVNKHNSRTEILNREFQFPQMIFHKSDVISPHFILYLSFVWKIDAHLIF